MVGTSFSDHAPVILVLAKEALSFSQALCIPKRILLDEEMVKRLETIWLDVRWVAGSYVGSLARGLSNLSAMF